MPAAGKGLPFGAVTLGVSLKMYLGFEETLSWCRAVAALAKRHPAVSGGSVDLFILPSAPMLDAVRAILAGTGIGFGAQDICDQDAGAFTGGVSPKVIHEMGGRYAEIGHAERRTLFRESGALIARKVAAAVRNGLTPVLCVGETERGSIRQAAELSWRQVASALREMAPPVPRLIVAYEPRWAIGAARPAGVRHITGVCRHLQRRLDQDARFGGSRVIYGGSAGPGLLSKMGRCPAGLFLGRFAHHPGNLEKILDEALIFSRIRGLRSPSVKRRRSG